MGNMSIGSHDRWFSKVQDDQLVQRGREPNHLTLALADVIRDLQVVIWKAHDFNIGLRSLYDQYMKLGGRESDINVNHLGGLIFPL